MGREWPESLNMRRFHESLPSQGTETIVAAKEMVVKRGYVDRVEIGRVLRQSPCVRVRRGKLSRLPVPVRIAALDRHHGFGDTGYAVSLVIFRSGNFI
jgi:hypothetical protein